MRQIPSTAFRFLFLLLFVALSRVEAQELRMGKAAVDITPPVGTPMQAPQRPPFEIKLAEEAHDPLFAKAVVLREGERKVAIVICDLTSIPVAIVRAARQEIGETTDIAPESVMISATHTHTTPQIRPRFVARANEEARRKTADYVQSLPSKIAEAVRLANRDLIPARVSAAIGHEDSISFNRRFLMKDGSVQTNPGKADASQLREIARSAGPIDPEVGIVVWEADDGQPLATLVNFAIHLDTMGGFRPSADFPFMLSRILSDAHGDQMLTLFAIGAAGNINHYDLLDPERVHRVKGVKESSRIGAILAAGALKSFRRLQPLRSTNLRMAREVVRLEMPKAKGEALAKRMGNAPRFFDGEVDVINEGGHQWFDAEVQVIALGDELAWVGLPGEMFAELGLALKNASPFRYTMIHTLANGSIGYVPDRKAYPQGGYEADASRCAAGSGELLIETAARLLIQVKASPSRD